MLAPGSDPGLLRIVAALLAGGSHIEALRGTTEALGETTEHLVRAGRLTLAGELMSVTRVVDRRINELARRPGIWR